MNIPSISQEPKQINNRRKVAVASTIGSAVGIAASVAGIYAMAKKGNPSLALKNLIYQEKDVFMIGTGAIAGGLAGGLIADKDKENVVPKVREAAQQMIGNTLFPVTFLAVGNKILEKTNFKLPKIQSSSKPAQVANVILSALPKIAVTLTSLVCGAHVGNKVVNEVNNKIFKEDVNREVAAEDMLVHTDDICLAVSMLTRNAPKIAMVSNTILPATFLVSGAKAGMQQKENC